MILFLFLSLTLWFYILYLIQDQPKQIKNIVLRLTFWSFNFISWCMNFEICSNRQSFWVVRHIVHSSHLPSADSRSTDSPSVTLFSTKSGYTSPEMSDFVNPTIRKGFEEIPVLYEEFSSGDYTRILVKANTKV